MRGWKERGKRGKNGITEGRGGTEASGGRERKRREEGVEMVGRREVRKEIMKRNKGRK